jgi:DNA-binding MarR family transcriptional regulator
MAHFARIERQHQVNANLLLKRHGLKHAEWRILALTEEFTQVSVSQIVDLVVIERTTIGKLIDRMVERGWLSKERSAQDARSVTVGVTAAGRKLLQQTAPAMQALMQRYSEALSQTEFSELMNTLQKYGRQVQESPMRGERRNV